MLTITRVDTYTHYLILISLLLNDFVINTDLILSDFLHIQTQTFLDGKLVDNLGVIYNCCGDFLYTNQQLMIGNLNPNGSHNYLYDTTEHLEPAPSLGCSGSSNWVCVLIDIDNLRATFVAQNFSIVSMLSSLLLISFLITLGF